MRLSATLSLYLGRQILTGIGYVFLVMLSLVFLVDLVEHLRRAADREEAGIAVVAMLAVLQLPSLAQKLLPFAALFGAIVTLSRLTRTHELIVARASGVSVWQFLAPALAIALLLGLFTVTLFNPLSSALVARYEQMETRYLEGRPHLLEVAPTGVWLRQVDEAGQSVVHARQVSAEGMHLRGVIIFLYDEADRFVGRIDGETARLADGHWEISNAVMTAPDRPAASYPTYRLPTTLTLGQIQESFASPETLSFWSLPRFIRTLEATGFSAVRHRLHWHALLATPVLLCGMVLLAATFSLRLTRRGHTGLLVALGVLAGFLLYFLSDLVFALGMAGNIPVILAAWTPAGISMLAGLAMLFHLEDG